MKVKPTERGLALRYLFDDFKLSAEEMTRRIVFEHGNGLDLAPASSIAWLMPTPGNYFDKSAREVVRLTCTGVQPGKHLFNFSGRAVQAMSLDEFLAEYERAGE